ncbi:MAG: FGGY-family carbohydrate kinase [Ktedonobacteraceae bacterium]
MNPVTPSGNIWLGIDVGTQSVRAIAVSSTGEILGANSQRLTSRRDGHRHEQNPEDWWHATVAACRTALTDLPTKAIRGVAVDSTSGTILLVDHLGQPLTPGLMHDDNRAVNEARHVNEIGADVWATLGYQMQPSWALPKLLWILREYGDMIHSTHTRIQEGIKVAHQTDFINRHLVGCEVPTDTSSSLKMGYDLIKDAWPQEIFAQLEIPEEILPNVVLSGTQIGTICTQAAMEMGIPAGTAVIAGMTDSCAAQIGAGALNVGSWNSVLGTTLAFKGVTQELIRDPAGVMYSHRSPDGGWLPGGASGAGASLLGMYFPDRDLDALSSQAMKREPASIVAYPLASYGERFPFSVPEAERFLLGEPTDEIDLYAALLQGVAFVERLSFDYLDMLGAPIGGELSLTGGGARSRYWCQLRADVLGRSVRIPENAEAALGMAVLAASVGRRVADVTKEMSRTREVIDPRPDHIGCFQKSYIRLIDELEHRGWLPSKVAEHARGRV